MNAAAALSSSHQCSAAGATKVAGPVLSDHLTQTHTHTHTQTRTQTSTYTHICICMLYSSVSSPSLAFGTHAKGCPHLCPTQSYYCFLNGPLSFGSLGDKSLLEQDQFPFFDTRIQCGPHFSTMSDSFGNSKYWKILVMIHFSKEILKKLSSWGWTKVLLSCHLCQPPRACRMSSDTRYPAAHVSLPLHLLPPRQATAYRQS